MRILIMMVLGITGAAALAQRPNLNLPKVTIVDPILEPGPPGCPRYRVPLSDVANQLTRVSGTAACMPPPTPCNKTWHASQTRDIQPFNSAAQLWRGMPNQIFNSSLQNGIITDARNAASGQIPTGTHFFLLQFFTELHGTGPHAPWRIWARAYYGTCSTPH
jgi:hypothetical protein